MVPVEQIPHTTIIQSNFEFLQDALDKIIHAKRRVWGQTMDWSPDHPVGILFHRMSQAAQRGVETSLTVSPYGHNTIDDAWNIHHRLPIVGDPLARLRRILKDKDIVQLNDRNVDVHTSRPKRVPWHPWQRIFCEDHMKQFGVDDTAWILTMNITAGSFKYADKAIRTDIPEVVETLRWIFDQVKLRSLSGSARFWCTPEYEILVDYYLKGRDSLIYQIGNELVQSETKILKACAMLPYHGDILESAIDLAERKIPVEIILSNWTDPIINRFPYNLYYVNLRRRIKSLYPYIKLYHHRGTMHIKGIIGTKEAMIGSHNMDQFLTDFMPPDELQLLTRDTQLLANLDIMFEDLKRDATLLEY